MSTPRRLAMTASVGVAVWLLAGGFAAGQEGKSASLAKELAAQMQQGNLTYAAVKSPGSEKEFIAVLFISPGTLLVVSAQYSAPQILEERLKEKGYQDVYQELQSASIRETKVFVSDLGADGMRARPTEGQPFDTFSTDEGRTAFNGDWRQQKITEDEYQKRFNEADTKYSTMLTTLLGALKKLPS